MRHLAARSIVTLSLLAVLTSTAAAQQDGALINDEFFPQGEFRILPGGVPHPSPYIGSCFFGDSLHADNGLFITGDDGTTYASPPN